MFLFACRKRAEEEGKKKDERHPPLDGEFDLGPNASLLDADPTEFSR